MGKPTPPRSSTLLLVQLLACPADADAWDKFVVRYGGVIYGWCRHQGLQDADAQDVTQSVFAGLLHGLSGFDRSRARFRTWLYRIVQNRVKDWCQERSQRLQKGSPDVWDALARQEARKDLATRLNEEFDMELLELAEVG